MRRNYLILIVLIAALLAACAPAASNTQVPAQANTPLVPTRAPAQTAATPTVEALTAADQNAVQAPAAVSNAPAWLSLPITDARTGSTFTLADFAGKTVWVEPMATWCTRCASQLPHVEAARVAINSDQYVFVSFSVAENVDNATLAQYVDGKGWNWLFAIATEPLTQGMVDTFGRTVVSPPSTPHFIIKPDGSVSDILTGSPSADEIIAELRAVGGA